MRPERLHARCASQDGAPAFSPLLSTGQCPAQLHLQDAVIQRILTHRSKGLRPGGKWQRLKCQQIESQAGAGVKRQLLPAQQKVPTIPTCCGTQCHPARGFRASDPNWVNALRLFVSVTNQEGVGALKVAINGNHR